MNCTIQYTEKYLKLEVHFNILKLEITSQIYFFRFCAISSLFDGFRRML